jgi:hypothetical protein
VSVGEALTLTASASDDGIPKPPPASTRAGAASDSGVLVTLREQRPITQAIVKPSRQGAAVTWTHWRGPGRLTFDPMTSLVKDGKVTAKVTFSQPGTYVIRAYADDGVVTTPADVTVIVKQGPKAADKP